MLRYHRRGVRRRRVARRACELAATRCQLRTQLGNGQVCHLWCAAGGRLRLRSAQLLSQSPESASGVRCMNCEKTRSALTHPMVSSQSRSSLRRSRVLASCWRSRPSPSVWAARKSRRRPSAASREDASSAVRRETVASSCGVRGIVSRREQTGLLRSTYLVGACRGSALHTLHLRLCCVQAATKACNLRIGVAKATLHEHQLALFQAGIWVSCLIRNEACAAHGALTAHLQLLDFARRVSQHVARSRQLGAQVRCLRLDVPLGLLRVSAKQRLSPAFEG